MERKYGLCFAGGGGKGSYQLGVWKALKSLGKDLEIKAVSGASIGALNAAMFATGAIDTAEAEWKKIKNTDFLSLNTSTGYCSRKHFRKIMDRAIDYDALKFSEIRCFAGIAKVQEYSYLPDGILGLGMDYLKYPSFSAIKEDVDRSVQEMEAEYREINKLEKEQIIDILTASSAMPVVYKPVEIDGAKYIDGGMVDNVPIRPLIEDAECSDLIIVKLHKDNEYNLYVASRADSIMEITPSKSIGDGLLDGTLDFNSSHVEFRMQLGFYDTLRAFDIAERKKLGIPYTKEELAEKERKDIEKAEQMARMGNSLDKAAQTRSSFDNLLGKYGKKYGIDLNIK